LNQPLTLVPLIPVAIVHVEFGALNVVILPFGDRV
jgi:hypothetical protein